MFVKGIATVRTLSAAGGGLSRPPAETRAELYGLYKQATEGDVDGLMDRPVGDELNERKWDAWKSFEGIKPTEAKKRYITLLIETMRSYASSTPQARELLNELETMWEQVRDVSISSSSQDSPLFGSLSLGDRTQNGLRMGKDMDDVELRRWKREISRALETLNEEVLTLRSRVSELSNRPVKYQSYLVLLIKKLWGFLWPLARRVAIDGSVVLILWYIVQWVRANPGKTPPPPLSRALTTISASLSSVLTKLQ